MSFSLGSAETDLSVSIRPSNLRELVAAGPAFKRGRASAPENPGALRTEVTVGHAGRMAGPGFTPYAKAGAGADRFVEGFRWQASAWDCEPTQIFNILQEFSRRRADPALGLSIDIVHRVFPAALEGPSWLHAVHSLGRRVPTNYRIRYALGSTQSRWGQVEEVLRSEDCSLPLIAVSTDYWGEVSTSPAEGAGMDHALVVLGETEGQVLAFDSYVAILSKSTRSKLKPTKLKITDGVLQIDQVKLISYWEGAQIPRYHLWFQRTGGRGVQRKLDALESEA